MSATGKLAAYAGLGLLFLALVYSAESTLGADFGISIPSEFKIPMNITAFLLVTILAILFALHLRSDDDGD